MSTIPLANQSLFVSPAVLASRLSNPAGSAALRTAARLAITTLRTLGILRDVPVQTVTEELDKAMREADRLLADQRENNARDREERRRHCLIGALVMMDRERVPAANILINFDLKSTVSGFAHRSLAEQDEDAYRFYVCCNFEEQEFYAEIGRQHLARLAPAKDGEGQLRFGRVPAVVVAREFVF